MTADLCVEALGVSMLITADDPGLKATVRDLLVDLIPSNSTTGPLGQHRIQVDGTDPWSIRSPAHSVVSHSAESAVGETCAAVNLNAVAATSLLAFHCAVLARNHRTLVIPGASGLGKTTLTAGLLLRGWDYVSDEALGFRRDDGALTPYPRPLGLSDWSAHSLGIDGGTPVGGGERLLRARDLGAAIAYAPTAVTDIVLIERTGDVAEAPELMQERPHRADVVAEFIRRGFTHHVDVAAAMQKLADVVRSAAVHRLRLADPKRTADLVDNELT